MSNMSINYDIEKAEYLIHRKVMRYGHKARQ